MGMVQSNRLKHQFLLLPSGAFVDGDDIHKIADFLGLPDCLMET